MTPTRVVSLVPSATETLLAWGVDVVACTRFCEQPTLRHVGGTKDPDVDAIVALRPDLVVLDREENRREDAEALAEAGVRVHVMHVVSLDGLHAELAALAAAVGLVVRPAVPAVRDHEWTTAATLIWRRPWMTTNGATYGSTLLEHVGVRNVFASAPERYPVVSLDDLAERAPGLVLLPSEPYPFRPRHAAEVRAAVPGATVVAVDGQDLFWWGARTPAAIERLRAALRAARPPV